MKYEKKNRDKEKQAIADDTKPKSLSQYDKYFMRNLSLIVMDKGTLRWFLSIAYAFCTAHKNNVIRLISAHIPRT